MSFRKPSTAEVGGNVRRDLSTIAEGFVRAELAGHAGELKLVFEGLVEDEDGRLRKVFDYERFIGDVRLRSNTVVVEVDPATGEVIGFSNKVNPKLEFGAEWKTTYEQAVETVEKQLQSVASHFDSLDLNRDELQVTGAQKECLPMPLSADQLSVDVPVYDPPPSDYLSGWVVTVKVTKRRNGEEYHTAFEVLVDAISDEIVNIYPLAPEQESGNASHD